MKNSASKFKIAKINKNGNISGSNPSAKTADRKQSSINEQLLKKLATGLS